MQFRGRTFAPSAVSHSALACARLWPGRSYQSAPYKSWCMLTSQARRCRSEVERMRNLGSLLTDAHAFVSAHLGNTEPETEAPAIPPDARRDNPPRAPRRSASAPNAPRPWPTTRDLRARNPLSQNAVHAPQNANAPAGGPGAFTLHCVVVPPEGGTSNSPSGTGFEQSSWGLDLLESETPLWRAQTGVPARLERAG
jgi:hypothetical protein